VPEPADFVSPCLECIGGEGSLPLWPSINARGGLPALLLGAMTSMFVGIDLVLKWLPIPDPTDPDFPPSLPTIDLFIDGFLGGVPNLPPLPDIEVLGITIPGTAELDPITNTIELDFDGQLIKVNPLGFIAILKMFIMAPFQIFFGIIDSIINLSPEIPGLSLIINILLDVAASVGIPVEVGNILIPCVAHAFSSILEILPV